MTPSRVEAAPAPTWTVHLVIDEVIEALVTVIVKPLATPLAAPELPLDKV